MNRSRRPLVGGHPYPCLHAVMIGVALLASAHCAAAVPDGRSLPALVRWALEHNPELSAMRQQHAAARERVTQSGRLPDPRVSYRYFVDPVETRVGPQEHAVGISQSLPWFGKRKADRQVAEATARADAARIDAVRNDVIAAVAGTWYELYYLARSIDVVRANRDLVAHLESIARTRLGAGASRQADLLRAQVELGRADNELASLEDRRVPVAARLNALLNLPSGVTLASPGALPYQPLELDEEWVLMQIGRGNPGLEAAEHEVRRARSVKARARQSFSPDIAVGIDYIAVGDARAAGVRGSGDDALSASLAFTVPIWHGRYTAGVREAQAHIEQAQREKDRQANALQADALQALFEMRDAQRQIDLYEQSLLPMAGESLAATQRSYSAGTSSFVDLIAAQRMLLDFELAIARAVTNHNQARVDIERLMGRPLQTSAGGATP